MYIQPFNMEVDWPEIWCLMEVSTMFYIYRYCLFTLWGSIMDDWMKSITATLSIDRLRINCTSKAILIFRSSKLQKMKIGNWEVIDQVHLKAYIFQCMDLISRPKEVILKMNTHWWKIWHIWTYLMHIHEFFIGEERKSRVRFSGSSWHFLRFCIL